MIEPRMNHKNRRIQYTQILCRLQVLTLEFLFCRNFTIEEVMSYIPTFEYTTHLSAKPNFVPVLVLF